VSRFRTTGWDLIDAARLGEDLAVTQFVERYRSPLVEYVRLQGRSAEDAEDTVQEIFLRLFAKDLLQRVDANKGRFRSYLLAMARNVLSEQRKRESADKRGGDRQRVTLTESVATVEDPDPQFDACWCRDLLQRGLDLLKAEHPQQFEVLEMRLVQELGEIRSYCSDEAEFEHELQDFLQAFERS
jgi:RNA polymerase sigma factor (sigma-70 family)